MPNYTLLFKTSTPCSLFLAIGYYALRQMPFVREWCEGDNWFKPSRESNGYTLAPAGIEEHQCALTCVLIGAGMAAVVVSVVISVAAGMGVVMEQRGVGLGLGMGRRRGGYAALDPYEIGDDYDGSTVCSVEEVE
jgi:hypothetical protein